jgi:hypothetical protein
VRSTIPNFAVRPVVIIFLDPTSDRCSRFFQAAILRRPDCLVFQATMEALDVAVAFRVMITVINRESMLIYWPDRLEAVFAACCGC